MGVGGLPTLGACSGGHPFVSDGAAVPLRAHADTAVVDSSGQDSQVVRHSVPSGSRTVMVLPLQFCLPRLIQVIPEVFMAGSLSGGGVGGPAPLQCPQSTVHVESHWS